MRAYPFSGGGRGLIRFQGENAGLSVSRGRMRANPIPGEIFGLLCFPYSDSVGWLSINTQIKKISLK